MLWYISKPFHQVIGCSFLIDVVDGTPKELFRRYRRLGVYTFDMVRRSSRSDGTVRAWNVIDTEVFPHPVPLGRLRRMAAEHSHTLQLQSTTRVSSDLFATILKEGRHGRR